MWHVKGVQVSKSERTRPQGNPRSRWMTIKRVLKRQEWTARGVFNWLRIRKAGFLHCNKLLGN